MRGLVQNFKMAEERKDSTAEKAGEPNGISAEKTIDLDYVLVNELGQFGRYQMLFTVLVSIPLIMSAFMSEFIFGAAAIPHRYGLSSGLSKII